MTTGADISDRQEATGRYWAELCSAKKFHIALTGAFVSEEKRHKPCQLGGLYSVDLHLLVLDNIARHYEGTM